MMSRSRFAAHMAERRMTRRTLTIVAGLIVAVIAGVAVLAPYFGLPGSRPTGAEIPVGAFLGRYYDNANLTDQKVERIEAAIDFDWGTGSPDPLISPDTFSARWEGYWDIAVAQRYRFTIVTDDGIRVWVDNASLLDSWIAQPRTVHTRDVDLTVGQHLIEVEW